MQKTDHGNPVDPDGLCESLTKRGRPCQNPPVAGQRFCAYHGGQVAERRAERVQLLSSPEALGHALDPEDIQKRRRRDG
jgi:hypothetical protein